MWDKPFQRMHWRYITLEKLSKPVYNPDCVEGEVNGCCLIAAEVPSEMWVNPLMYLVR